MSDSCNLVINVIDDKYYQKDYCVGKFELFDKLAVVSNLLRKADLSTIEIATTKPLTIKMGLSNNNNNNNDNTLALTRAKNSKLAK